MKTALIAEIKQIYRDLGCRRLGKPLESFDELSLQRHLAYLKDGGRPPGLKVKDTAEGGGATPTHI